jgi:heavy metal sensor kinase
VGAFREAYHFTELGDCVLVGRSIASDLASMRAYAVWILMAGVGMLALGCGGVWWLAYRALRPIAAIGNAAGRISAGNLSERINVRETEDELGQMAGVLNSMFGRLEAAFAQQRQFTADASHELRTPLTVMITEAQTALSRERSAADYRDAVVHCLDAAQQMRRLTESLLELARFDAGQEMLHRSAFDLAACVRTAVGRLDPLVRSSGVPVELHLHAVQVLADSDRLERVVMNLVLNAVHYNKPGGRVDVTTGVDGEAAVLRVSDSGTGIAPEDLPHVFERFYRADKSRARAEGRSGLGLAICQSIVSAHGGTLSVESILGAGTTFTVRLPGPQKSPPAG